MNRVVRLGGAALTIGFGAPIAKAQTPAPAGDFATEMAKLVDRASDLVPLIQNQVESPLIGTFEEIAFAIAAIVMMLSFARVVRENDGASKDLFYWVSRLVICMILFGTGPLILNSLHKMGQAIVWNTPIKAAYDTQLAEFDSNYGKFLEAGFTVPSGEDGKGPFGVLIDNESPVRSIDKSLNPSTWNMPTIFLLLTVARGLLEFADLFLILLTGFIMVALRLASPFMIAVAIDQKLAHQISYPFVKGAAIFTLVTPAIGTIIGIFAYAAANVPLGLLDFNDSVFKLDPETMRISGDPTLTVYPSLVGAAIMLVGALALFFSPYLSYRLASGQVVEGVATVATGWMGALTATAVEIAGARQAAHLHRQAENTQIHGSYSAAEISARTAYDVRALTIKAGVAEKMAAIYGNARSSAGTIIASAGLNAALARTQYGFFLGTQRADTGRALGRNEARNTEANITNLLETERQLKLAAGRQQANTYELAGDAVRGGAGAVDSAVKGGRGATGASPGHPIISAATSVIVPGAAITSKNAANITMTDTSVRTAERYQQGQLINQRVLKESLNKTETDRLSAYEVAAQANLDQTLSANREFQKRATGAVYAGANQAAGGVKQSAGLLGEANTRELTGALKAASEMRQAGLEAARLRAMASVIGLVTRDMARRLEQGMTLRY